MQIIPLFYHLPMDRLWQCKLMLVHTLNHLWQQSLSTSHIPPGPYAAATVNPTEGITYSEARSLMAAKSSPGGFVVATVTNPGSFMATITHPTGNGYCRDRILRDRPLRVT